MGSTSETYAQLLHELSRRGLDHTTPDLRDNILAFYAALAAPGGRKRNDRAWRGTLGELVKLRTLSIPPDSRSLNEPKGTLR